MSEAMPEWNARYLEGRTPWDSGRPSLELQRVLTEVAIAPGRALELGCGSGTNAIWLARRGFAVTAVDVSPRAIEVAREKAAQAGVEVAFKVADLVRLAAPAEPFPFVFDRGVYHAVRRNELEGFLRTMHAVTAPGSWWLTLAGNANESAPPEGGPPRVRAVELCAELEPLFALVQLREFRMDGVAQEGRELRPLAWSALLQRRA